MEEYPIMACANIGFGLRPDGFFNENPSLDVPPSSAIITSKCANGSVCPTRTCAIL
jgi:primary-amine oxidase